MIFFFCIVIMFIICDLFFVFYVYFWEGYIFYCFFCVIFIICVIKVVVFIYKFLGIFMCDRKGCYKYLLVNKRGELKLFNININFYGN